MCVYAIHFYEIYPKTVRAEIIFETDGTAAVPQELPMDIDGDDEGTLKQVKILYNQECQPQSLEMGPPLP